MNILLEKKTVKKVELFLKNYDDPLFVGIKDEYDDLKKQVPNFTILLSSTKILSN